MVSDDEMEVALTQLRTHVRCVAGYHALMRLANTSRAVEKHGQQEEEAIRSIERWFADTVRRLSR